MWYHNNISPIGAIVNAVILLVYAVIAFPVDDDTPSFSATSADQTHMYLQETYSYRSPQPSPTHSKETIEPCEHGDTAKFQRLIDCDA